MKYIDGCVGERNDIKSYFKGEIYSAKEIITIRDSISKEKTDNFTKLN
ncbi:hypothetical protein [Chryseobacterium mucoviscidosis]